MATTRSYRCNYCGKTFGLAGRLADHIHKWHFLNTEKAEKDQTATLWRQDARP
jgi:DNA-directed RNA polymerase subunit RPC12/RpoP